jgi:2-polyprenyl-6-methoxyphenol hydroxylase-like FAD-dependent oxidoreductase
MAAVQTVLVVGGGAAGCASAIQLARAGIAVDLVEIKNDVTAVGSGITLQGNALRVLRDLGVYDDVAAAGYGFDTLGLRAPDGTVLVEMPDAKTGGSDLPATVGARRADLARVLVARAQELGAKLRFGTTVDQLVQDESGVEVTFSDGGTGRYDLVVGADGVRSHVRTLLGVEVDIAPVGMGIWRVFTGRPAGLERTDLYYHGACYIAGYCPTGEDSIYAYLVEDAQDRSWLSPDEQLEVMRELAGQYHGPWDDIRELMTDSARINYTHFEWHVLDGPWNRGRVVLIGDAAHSCPPTMAQGCAQALEDAAVLAEVLLDADGLDQPVFDTFTARRLPRARTVVENSVQLSRWLLDHVTDADVPGLMGRTAALLSQRP